MSDPTNSTTIQFQISNYTGYGLALNTNTGIQNGNYDPWPPSDLGLDATASFVATGAGNMTGKWGYFGPWALPDGFQVQFTVTEGPTLESSQIVLDYNFPFTGGTIMTQGQGGSFEVTVNLGADIEAK